MRENLEDCAFVLSHVFFVEGLDVLLIDVRDNFIDAHLVNKLMVDVVRPHGQMLLLDFEEVPPFGIILDRRVDKVGLSYMDTVEVIFLAMMHIFSGQERSGDIHAPLPTTRLESCLRSPQATLSYFGRCGS